MANAHLRTAVPTALFALLAVGCDNSAGPPGVDDPAIDPPDGQKNPGNVAIFDAATKNVVNVVEVPNFARFISFLP